MIESVDFGRGPAGEPVRLFTLSNGRGLVARITNFGGIVTHLMAPDRAGRVADVVLGFDSLSGYLAPHPYLGATIGRVAGRVTPPEFTLGGRRHALTVNSPPHHLHGGFTGFDRRVWEADVVKGPHGEGLRLGLRSLDGEEGYPGNVEVRLTYSLTLDNALELSYEAESDAETPLSLTNHSYFNLRGESAGEAGLHELQILADEFTPFGPGFTAAGRRAPVIAGVNDFRQPARLKERLGLLASSHGDHYLLGPGEGKPRPCARLFDPGSGRVMEVLTTEPGIQLYTAFAFDGSLAGKAGRRYGPFAGLCFECQRYSGGLHHPGFASLIVAPGRPYRQLTQFRFSTCAASTLPGAWHA